jgi:hypothetical protein
MSSVVSIGRRDAVGFGLETTAGTAVTPAVWERQSKLTLDQKTTVAEGKTAIYRVEDKTDSAVTEEWAEGSLEGRVSDITAGYLLKNIFGTCGAALHAGETTVYDNTFTVLQTSPCPTLTFARVNPTAGSFRYAFGNLSEYALDVKAGDWVNYTAKVSTNARASASDTPAFVTNNNFTSKHTVVKIASNVAGLPGATALQVKSLKLTIGRKVDKFTPLGQIDPAAWDNESFTVSGELVLRYTDTTMEALGIANTAQAMSIALTNTDITIGSTTHPTLTFTAPQVRFKPVTLDDNLEQVLNQTVQFSCELNTTAGYMLQAVLTNTQNSY